MKKLYNPDIKEISLRDGDTAYVVPPRGFLVVSDEFALGVQERCSTLEVADCVEVEADKKESEESQEKVAKKRGRPSRKDKEETYVEEDKKENG